MRECSVEIWAARCWSSQKPGAPIAPSSSAARASRRSGSKVITDPGKLGPDLPELFFERLIGGVGHPDRLSGRHVELSADHAPRVRSPAHSFAPVTDPNGTTMLNAA